MIAAIISALVLTWLQITILSIISTPWLVVQLIIITLVLAFRYEQPVFGWQIAFWAGLLFDLFSGLPFGVFLTVFIVTAMIFEQAFSFVERWGLTVTTVLATAAGIALYMITVLAIGPYSVTTIATATFWSFVATLAVLGLTILLIEQYNKRFG